MKNLEDIYDRAVKNPNQCLLIEKTIKCPECNSAILVVPSLKVMSAAIEKHVERHRFLNRSSGIDRYHIAIRVRLSLCRQVLESASHSVFY